MTQYFDVFAVLSDLEQKLLPLLKKFAFDFKNEKIDFRKY